MRPLNIIFISIISVFSFSCKEIALEKDDHTANKKDTVKISVLQTADIHGQLDTHPELFWENEKIVFKNRGGLAHIKTLFEEERAKNPGNTIVLVVKRQHNNKILAYVRCIL